jgi:peptidoglycan/LPS O-acetylase OafA/YrhL
LGTLFGEHLPRLVPPLVAVLTVSLAVQWVGRLLGQGTSAGERVAGLQLLDRYGQAPGLVRQGVRTIVGVLTAWPLGWLMCCADEDKQTLAERISGSRLVRRAD